VEVTRLVISGDGWDLEGDVGVVKLVLREVARLVLNEDGRVEVVKLVFREVAKSVLKEVAKLILREDGEFSDGDTRVPIDLDGGVKKRR
jgi:hypothetical protein